MIENDDDGEMAFIDAGTLAGSSRLRAERIPAAAPSREPTMTRS
ncbi:MAG: hypothetical protein R3A46_19435 [Thermomicrobiales bacterium]